ncbi:hypothetical protein GGR56DRAFT_618908 [Xylariaceae sp. FL0804]|nr:hypothetical protein GGR56DRAFT_618908 [Xylariaceae sp. FL0804]
MPRPDRGGLAQLGVRFGMDASTGRFFFFFLLCSTYMMGADNKQLSPPPRRVTRGHYALLGNSMAARRAHCRIVICSRGRERHLCNPRASSSRLAAPAAAAAAGRQGVRGNLDPPTTPRRGVGLSRASPSFPRLAHGPRTELLWGRNAGRPVE